MIRVLFFGPVAERIGARELELPCVAGMRLQALIEQLSAQHPGAFDIVSFIAVNQTQVHDTQLPLNDGDEIALMAKFSGG
ncbi:MoaD/ThiS family protein [Ferriphaselus sp. R-1]|uniref:MoaD/ThiS family protein n=1 Tax=Ferriphaselus sp. R-1 TaxID=1485544 RepID=UPI00055898EC|nr:MoaD/ThiS family protein [Ferriphaselus sp. R-1]